MKSKDDSLNWIPLWVDKWLFGSTRIELEPDERSVWVDLMALASKDRGHVRANVGIAYPMAQLAGMLCVNEELLARTLAKCEKVGKIKRFEDETYFLINWEEYQLSGRHKRRIGGEKKRMSAEKDITSLKKDITSPKEDLRVEKSRVEKSRKEKILYPPDSVGMKLSSFFLSLIKKNKPDFRDPDLQKWSHEINLMISEDKRSIESIEKVMSWVQNDGFWKLNILSIEKLREKFDQLELQMLEGKRRNEIIGDDPIDRRARLIFRRKGSSNHEET